MKLWSDNDINPVTDLCRSHPWFVVSILNFLRKVKYLSGPFMMTPNPKLYLILGWRRLKESYL